MKKTIILLSSAIIFFSGMISPKIDAISVSDPMYEYTIINNEATITGYKGEPIYIDIPETIEGCKVVELRDNAFYECQTLKHIDIPDTVRKIGHHCFYACSSLENIIIPDSVTDIGMGCFCGCSSLNTASLSSTIQSIPESCFRSCTSLDSLTIPDTVRQIGDFSFSGCISLKNISLGNELKSIGDCSFYMCTSLSSVYIPPSVTDIGVCALGYIPTDNGAEIAEDFVLLGDGHSYVHEYAKENHITFTSASDTVHAFAIQRISGERIPINIPSVTLIVTCLMILFLLFWIKRKYMTHSKANINKKRRK